jgi:ATP-dependent Clp protease adaptor protein ClpS
VLFLRNIKAMKNATLWSEEEEMDTLLLEVEERSIVVFNDDVNTFDDVIQWLVESCDHNPLQAEQCALIVHHNGKCNVKNGSFEELKPLATALLDRGLSVEIQ